MKKSIMLFMLLALSLSIFSCGGGGSGSADTPSGESSGVPSVVKLSPSHFIAQTNSFIFLHAQVFDGNGAPVKGVPVTFTNLSDPFGKITSAILRTLHLHKPIGILSTTEARTNGLGVATVKITSPSSGFATIQAEVNKGAGLVRDRKTVFFTNTVVPVTPPPPTITLHVDDGDGTYDQPGDFDLLKNANDNQRTIKAVVLDGFGNPLSGVNVTFGSDLPGEVTFTPSTPVLTNSKGEAFVTLTVNPSVITNLERVLNVTASADVNNVTIGAMITLFLEPVTVSNVAVTANPSVVPLNGISAIAATVTLSTGGVAPDGSTVSFTSTNGADPCGIITPFAQTTGGVATASFTAPSIPPAGGTCTITAAIAGVTGSTHVTVTSSLMVQPSSQTINGVAGGNVVFTIFGGSPGYTVTSSNPAIAFNTSPGNGIWNVATSGETFTVTVPANTPPATVLLTIRDQSGTAITAALTIGAGASLSVQPASQTIDGSAGGDATFTIFGGAPGYTVFANTANPEFQPDPSSVAASGGAFMVHVDPSTAATSVVYTIRDSLGATTTATLTITEASGSELSVSPASVSVTGMSDISDQITFVIAGGTGPFSMVSNNTAVVPNVLVSDRSFTIDPNVVATSTAVTLTVIDSLGANTTAAVTVTPATSSMAINPSAITVMGGTNNIEFRIIGGVSPFTVYSSNISVLTLDGATPGGPNTITAPTVTFTADAVGTGSAIVTVVDSDGKTITATVTVTTSGPDFNVVCNPSSRTIAAGGSDNTTCTVTSLNGYNNAVTLSCSGQPVGVTCGFDINPLTPPINGSSSNTLTIQVGALVTPNIYTFNVTGTDGTISHVSGFTLTVTP